MAPAELALLALASAVAGAINSVAGGGSIISWPAAVAAGLSQVTASATNTVALAPASIASAWAYRRELGENRSLAFVLCVPAAVGALGGALILFAAPASVFETVVPWLVLSAALLLLGQDALFRKAVAQSTRPSRRRVALVGAGVVVVAVYGGYFGAGMGIITLALLALLKQSDIHELNAMKNVVISFINGTAACYFLATGRAHLVAAAAMIAGSLVGGYGGAAIARRVEARKVRWLVVAIGVLLSAYLAWRRFA
jgi:uncharacterized protein